MEESQLFSESIFSSISIQFYRLLIDTLWPFCLSYMDNQFKQLHIIPKNMQFIDRFCHVRKAISMLLVSFVGIQERKLENVKGWVCSQIKKKLHPFIQKGFPTMGRRAFQSTLQGCSDIIQGFLGRGRDGFNNTWRFEAQIIRDIFRLRRPCKSGLDHNNDF